MATSGGNVVGVRDADEHIRELLVQVRGGDDAGNARVERKLQDDAPHGRRRGLHGVHQARGCAVQQQPDQQERQVDDIEVERVERVAACLK